jgi:CheY-specific phosphatase CheX
VHVEESVQWLQLAEQSSQVVAELANVVSGQEAKHSDSYMKYEFSHSVHTEVLSHVLQLAGQSSHVVGEVANVPTGQEAKHSDSYMKYGL